MTTDIESGHTRRALLAGAVGAAAASIATTLGHPAATRAANGEPVTLGDVNEATVNTRVLSTASTTLTVESSSTSGKAVTGQATAASGLTVGVYGLNSSTGGHGVRGVAAQPTGTTYGVSGQASSVSGSGVYGEASAANGTTRGVSGISRSTGGIGTHGFASAGSGTTYGVFGVVLSAAGTGTLGRSSGGGTGVYGFSGSGELPAGPTKTGVYGRAAQDAGARGVHGVSTAGRGVFGQATSGQGVRGLATTGTGVYASVADPAAGYALRAVGRVKFDHCSGVATIVSGDNAVTVVPGVELGATSAPVATLLSSGSGAVEFIIVDPTGNAFTIYLAANVTSDVKVAWHVFG